MTLILETGSGVRGANSYVTAAFVTTYLTDRGRQTENSWSSALTAAQEAACVAATDYIDNRFSGRFKGVKQFRLLGAYAEALATFDTNPSNDDTITIGDRTYTFKTALGTQTVDEVLIGSDLEESLDNLVAAIALGNTAGTNYSAKQIANRSVVASKKTGTTNQLLLSAVQQGSSGNDIPLSATGGFATITSAFTGGADPGPQFLEFPRVGLTDSSGLAVSGMPIQLKYATAEYAVRAASTMATLFRDPTVDDTGRAIIEEQVGPIRTRYAEGTAITTVFRPYPAADQLLAPFLKSRGPIR